MVKSKKIVKKENKKKKVFKKVEEKEEMSLDDAFADDSDVEYAKSKPRKEKKKSMDDVEIESEIEEAEEEEVKMSKEMNGDEIGNREFSLKASKSITKIKKGDKVKIDDIEYEVDDHSVLMDHGTTKEMAIDIFNPKTDKDYQLRYFNDQVESTLDFYELQEIMYLKRAFKKIEW